MSFPFDIFPELMNGNWIAWAAVILFIGVVALVCGLIFLWVKLPQFAKTAFINNTVGGNRPIVLELYENRLAEFVIPKLLRGGIGVLNSAWFLFPKAWASSADELSSAERDMLNGICTLKGTQAALYVNLAVQAQVMNPELLAILQHESTLADWNKKDSRISVKKEVFVEALKLVKSDMVDLHPMILNLPVDVKGLRTALPKSLSKSELTEQENRIKKALQDAQSGLNVGVIGVFLGVINLVMMLVLLLKQFGIL